MKDVQRIERAETQNFYCVSASHEFSIQTQKYDFKCWSPILQNTLKGEVDELKGMLRRSVEKLDAQVPLNTFCVHINFHIS